MKPKEGMSCAHGLHGVELVRNGVIWRNGDRNSVNIWEDPWLPRAWSRRVSDYRGSNIMSKVSELINPVTGQWDMDLLQQSFCQEDIELISSIPLREGMEDSLAWHFDPKGNFSVKSAYKLHVEETVRLKGSNAESSNAPTSSLGPRVETTRCGLIFGLSGVRIRSRCFYSTLLTTACLCATT